MSWIDIPPKGTLAKKLDYAYTEFNNIQNNIYYDTVIKLADYVSLYGANYCSTSLLLKLVEYAPDVVLGFKCLKPVIGNVLIDASDNNKLGETLNTYRNVLGLDLETDWSKFTTLETLYADTTSTETLLSNDDVFDLFVGSDKLSISVAENIKKLKSIVRALCIVSSNETGLKKFKETRTLKTQSVFMSDNRSLSNALLVSLTSGKAQGGDSSFIYATNVGDKKFNYSTTKSVYGYSTTVSVNEFVIGTSTFAEEYHVDTYYGNYSYYSI